MANVIMRPVFDRPEMLYLSVEHEIEARKHHMLEGDFITLFLVEQGSPQLTLKLVEQYPFRSYCILRPRKFGLTINILEGMKEAFGLADDYVVYIEDDILLHKTYFEYMDILLNMEDLGGWSVLSPYNKNDDGDVNEIYRGHHYAALAPLINKEFYGKYILECSTPRYYDNPPEFVSSLNYMYSDHWESGDYKYKDTTHYEQAGLLNRLVDAAMIDDGMHVIMPKVNRQQHIGFGGKNRRSKPLEGGSFEERLANLREIIKSPESLYDMTLSKEYNDYKIFSPKLNNWDGVLYIK